MRSDQAFRPIIADEFLAIDFGTDREFALVDGVIRMMTGGTSVHSHVAGNIYFALRKRRGGTGCVPFNFDMGVQVDDTNVRYPDVSVFCGGPIDRDKPASLSLPNPRVIVEVLSPSTSEIDQGGKLDEYRSVDALDTVVSVDPVDESTRVLQRLGPGSRRDDTFARPHDVELPLLAVLIPHAEIFARD